MASYIYSGGVIQPLYDETGYKIIGIVNPVGTNLIFSNLAIANTFTAAQRGEITSLTDEATITPNFNDSNFFSVTLEGNRTLANPTNLVAGQSGSIFITQDATGSRTLAFGSYWDFAGGVAPSLSTGANVVDRLDYVVRNSTSIHTQLSKAWS